MKTEAAQCAKEIKKVLKEKYPTIDFTVRSKNFSGGDDVNVYWNLGPTEQEIEKIIDEYSDGDFDGMIDLYEYRKHTDNKPRAKYVFAKRELMTLEEKEIRKQNEKVRWNDPQYIDVHKEGKTFYHQMTRDLCALFGLPEMRPDSQVPELYRSMSRSGHCYITWSDIIHSLLHDTPLMNGYHGVRLRKWEDGTEITNAAEVY